MQYTEQIEDSLFGWDFNEDTDDENYNNVINFLNAEFRTFGDGLTAVTEQKIGKPVQDPVKTIKSLCKNATMDYKIIGNDGTLHNWFKESKRPKKVRKAAAEYLPLHLLLN